MKSTDLHTTQTELSRQYHAAHERRDDIHRRRIAGEAGLAGQLTLINREIRQLAEQLDLVPRRLAPDPWAPLGQRVA